MFCAFDFSYANIPVAVHSTWSEQQGSCVLNMFTKLRDAESFLSDLSHTEAEALRLTLPHLRNDPLYGNSQKFRGDVAATFTAFLVAMRNHAATSNSLDCESPDFMGFYDPPKKKHSPGEGIALWYHPDEGYRVAIMHSQEQGKEILNGLSWVNEERSIRFHQRVRKWNVLPRSQTPITRYEGVIAELLCKGALVSKVIPK